MASKKILVVDDEKDTRESISELLDKGDYIYEKAETGQKAIELVRKAKESDDPFNVVLMDEFLGDKSKYNGTDTIQEIKDISPDSKVIIMTGVAGREESMKARRKGAFRYIYKPEKLKELTDIIDYIDELENLEEQLLKHSKERFWLQQIIKNVSCGISIIDRSWRIIYMNKKQKKMLPLAKIGGICWVEYNQTERRIPCEWCPVKHVFDKGEKYHYSITISPDSKGDPRYYDVEAVPIYDKQGQIIAALEAVTDVNDREGLYSMHDGILGTLELDERLEIILKSIRTLGYDRARLYLLSEDGQYLEGKVQAGGGLTVDIKEIKIPLKDDRLSQKVFESRTPEIFKKPWKHTVLFEGQIGRDKLDESIELPLIDGQGNPIGKISVDNLITRKTFNEDDTKRLTSLANHAANAIIESGSYESIRRHADQLIDLRKIDEEITKELTKDPVLSMIVASLKGLTGALSCFVRLKKGDSLEVGAGVGPYQDIAQILSLSSEEDKDSVSVRAVQTGKPVFAKWHENNTHLMRQQYRAVTQEQKDFFEKLRIWSSFPLEFGGETLGVLSIESDRQDFFNDAMKSLILDFCRRASIAIRNATLYEDMQEGLEARSKLMRQLSHDLRSPISHIIRQIDIIKMSSAAKEMKEKALKIIEDEMNWYDQMFCKLMAFSMADVKKLKLNLSEFELRSTIDKVMDIWTFRIEEKELKIIKDFPDSEIKVVADSALTRDVINVLLENAIKYNFPRGTITLRIKDMTDKVIIEIEDTGIGIAENDKNKIFELFYTKDAPQINSKGGAGIGLATCKHIIEEHGGKIEFDSRDGFGSRFWFSLPKKENIVNE